MNHRPPHHHHHGHDTKMVTHKCNTLLCKFYYAYNGRLVVVSSHTLIKPKKKTTEQEIYIKGFFFFFSPVVRQRNNNSEKGRTRNRKWGARACKKLTFCDERARTNYLLPFFLFFSFSDRTTKNPHTHTRLCSSHFTPFLCPASHMVMPECQ